MWTGRHYIGGGREKGKGRGERRGAKRKERERSEGNRRGGGGKERKNKTNRTEEGREAIRMEWKEARKERLKKCRNKGKDEEGTT